MVISNFFEFLVTGFSNTFVPTVSKHPDCEKTGSGAYNPLILRLKKTRKRIQFWTSSLLLLLLLRSSKALFFIYVSIPTLALATRTSSIWWSTAFWPDNTNFPKVLSLLIHFEFEYFISAFPETIYSIMVWTEKFLYVNTHQFKKNFCFEACVKFLFFQSLRKRYWDKFSSFFNQTTQKLQVWFLSMGT